MRTYYPNIKHYDEHRIAVDNLHTLYVEESGSKDGIPVLFVHGGPGGGCSPKERSFFDPEKYRIILFDQRGCGQSTPHASLRDNTTQHLVADIEKIREHLNIDKWMLFGGSWGSTLSLVYAQTHPGRVLGLILRGIFLCRDQDVQWLYQDGASRVFPDCWKPYQAIIPKAEHSNMVEAYHRRLTSSNELERMGAAKAWSVWEGSICTLEPSSSKVDHFANPHVALAMARVECHYFLNNGFMELNQILNNVDRLAGIPAIIVHGRYDMVCPVDQAFDLQRAWPEAKLEIIRDAGHSSSEPGIIDALVKATDEFAYKFGDVTF
jgi:proline iminopeptidase